MKKSQPQSRILTSEQRVTYLNSRFSLIVEPGFPQTNITFYSHTAAVRTGCIPNICDLLRKNLPGVLKTQCHNNEGWGFNKEVADTEIGHLFEHILIQNISELRQKYFMPDGKISGVTEWDWTLEPRGTFNIKIKSNSPYLDILNEAIENSMDLTSRILIPTKNRNIYGAD